MTRPRDVRPVTTCRLVALRNRAREVARFAQELEAQGHRAAAREMTEAAILLGSALNLLRRDFSRREEPR